MTVDTRAKHTKENTPVTMASIKPSIELSGATSWELIGGQRVNVRRTKWVRGKLRVEVVLPGGYEGMETMPENGSDLDLYNAIQAAYDEADRIHAAVLRARRYA